MCLLRHNYKDKIFEATATLRSSLLHAALFFDISIIIIIIIHITNGEFIHSSHATIASFCEVFCSCICGEQFLATLFIFKIFFQITIRCLCGWSGKAYKGPYAKNKKTSLAPNTLEIIS